MRLTACALLAAAALTVPATASAAEFETDVPCYAPGQTVTLTGSGWTPGASWTTSGGLETTTTVDGGGLVAASGTVPAIPETRRTPRTFTLSATDGTQTATAPLSVVNPGAMWNDKGRPTGLVRWSFGYLAPGQDVYVHVRRGARTVQTTRVGRAASPCGTVTARLRRLPVKPSKVRDGAYKIYVDNRKRFKAGGTPLQYAYTYTVRSTYRYR